MRLWGWPDGSGALLLPVEFDSVHRRRYLFDDCDAFAAKIVLTRRIVFYERDDGGREDPKDVHAWFIWQWPRQTEHPLLLYAPKECRP